MKWDNQLERGWDRRSDIRLGLEMAEHWEMDSALVMVGVTVEG